MNRNIARQINAALPRNVSIVHPGPAKAAERCARCRSTGVPLKAFEEKFACAACWRACALRFRHCAAVLGIKVRDLTARAKFHAQELADGEAKMPWHWSVAAEMVILDAGVAVPFCRAEEQMPALRTTSH